MGKKPRYKQGKFVPKYPDKYRGNPETIIYRSGLEKRYFQHFDTRKNVIEWASEEFAIPYTAPDGTRHRYFVDIWAKIRTRSGEIKEYICEIKPYSQTIPPVQPKRMSDSYRYRVAEYLINQCKWDAAEKFAMRNNLKFIKLTEKDIK